MDTMPERYETQQQTTTTTTETSGTTVGPLNIGVNIAYLRTLPGILKIIEMTLDLIVIICVSATAYNWSYSSAGGYVTFVGSFGLVTTLILFIFHFLGIIYKLPGPWVLIEFGYLIVMAIFFLIAGIVCAANSAYGGGAIAASIFSFAALVVHAVEIFLCFKVWRTGGGFYVATSTNRAAAATTTTTTSTTVKEEYHTSP